MTFAEIVEYVGKRTSGPLFLSPTGERLRQEKVLRLWWEAMDMGFVGANWPTGEPHDLELAHIVARSLRRRAPAISKGGNPKLVLRDKTVKRNAALAVTVERIMTALVPAYEKWRRGIDVHGLRSAHQTWADLCPRRSGSPQPRAQEAQEAGSRSLDAGIGKHFGKHRAPAPDRRLNESARDLLVSGTYVSWR